MTILNVTYGKFLFLSCKLWSTGVTVLVLPPVVDPDVMLLSASELESDDILNPSGGGW